MGSESRTVRKRTVFTSLLGATILVAAAAATTTPANALGGSSFTFSPSVSSGPVGVPVVINLTASDTFTPGGSLTVIPLGSNSGTAAPISVTNASGSTVGFKFIPPHVGSWTFSVQGGGSSTTSPAFIAQPVGVNVSVTVPNTAQVGTTVQLTATVSAQGGSQLAPLGSIQFAIVGSGNLGSPVWLSGLTPSTAVLPWTPGVVGPVQITATYTPSLINGFADTSCSGSCTSAASTVQVTTTGVVLYLAVPPNQSVGVPTTLTAVISARPSAGSVLFTVNGQAIGSRVGVGSDNTASTNWTPPAPGTYTIAANWTGNSGLTGGSQAAVAVGAAPAARDTIVLTQVGGSSWVPNGTYQLANGSTAAFTATTASGAAVTLSDTGPCGISGMSVSATQGSGGCILTASSPGGNGYGPGSNTYTIQLVPGTQVPRVQPLGSGRIKLGKKVTLEGPGNNDTNAGQNMGWKVTSGKANCKLRYPGNGSIRLEAVKRGSCNVRATAPAVPGQWNNLVLNRSYNVR